jgi:hypothetical protein
MLSRSEINQVYIDNLAKRGEGLHYEVCLRIYSPAGSLCLARLLETDAVVLGMV